MLQITLPDGKTKQFSEPVTIMQLAESIGPGLAKATLAGEVNGKLLDASLLIEADAQVRIITSRDAEGVEIIRHSCAHLFGHAVKQLFPETQMAIGPVIANGFYYDVASLHAFTPTDLTQIETRMLELVRQDYPVVVKIVTRDEAKRVFEERNECYKLKIIDDIPTGEIIKLYYHQEYVDMCRGPHVPNTAHLRAFRLTKVAGAYWRGDAKNEMLQRIYGTAWAKEKELKLYLKQIEEAEKRDHRKLGKQLDLFHIQEEAPGMIFWHPNGWTLYRILENYIRDLLARNGYQEIRTPQIVDRVLWEKSGHWDKFAADMFTTSSEHRQYAIKPMNCPGHVQIFNQGIKSYRELPLRLAEFGCCHRNEPSGTLHGLMRVRNFTQDDAHIFCTEQQLQSEVAIFIDLVFQVYQDFGFENILIKLSTRPEQRVGSDDMWDKAEAALSQALQQKQLNWQVLPGEGAFYGPKIEFVLQDCLGRMWQCGTVQVDFAMPVRLGAQYIDEQSQRVPPVMLHRAILGSFERFIGILIEHYAGLLPPWLAPVQVVILNITDRQVEFVNNLQKQLTNEGFRAEVDLRNEKIGYKIREHTLKKIPFMLIIGEKERETVKVTVRTCHGKDLGAMELSQFVAILKQSVAKARVQ